MKNPEVHSTDIIVLPTTGEVIDLNDARETGRALRWVREIETQLREVRSVLSDALVVQSQIAGTKTMHIEGVGTVEVKGGTATVYDAQEIERELREAGMPEERIREIVVEEVSYTVKAVEAKRAATANPVYGEIIERHKRVHEKRASVTLR